MFSIIECDARVLIDDELVANAVSVGIDPDGNYLYIKAAARNTLFVRPFTAQMISQWDSNHMKAGIDYGGLTERLRRAPSAPLDFECSALPHQKGLEGMHGTANDDEAMGCRSDCVHGSSMTNRPMVPAAFVLALLLIPATGDAEELPRPNSS
jgi:hypothetical protein